MRTTAFAAAAILLTSSAAYAGDWTGFYIGLNGGGASGSSNTKAADIGPDSFFDSDNVSAVTGGASQHYNTSGGMFGGQIGYLGETGNIILGAEASVDWADFSGSTSNGPTEYPDNASTFSWKLATKSDFLATFLARAGWDMGTWYPYVTAGGAIADFTYRTNFAETFYPTNSTNTFHNSPFGWALGAGAEFQLGGGWMLRGEYLHLDFSGLGGNGLLECSAGVGECDSPANQTTFRFKARVTEDLGRVALSYRL